MDKNEEIILEYKELLKNLKLANKELRNFIKEQEKNNKLKLLENLEFFNEKLVKLNEVINRFKKSQKLQKNGNITKDNKVVKKNKIVKNSKQSNKSADDLKNLNKKRKLIKKQESILLSNSNEAMLNEINDKLNKISKKSVNEK